MLIKLKDKNKLIVDEFIFKCCIGKKGLTNFKKEGDLKTPKGRFNLGSLFYKYKSDIKHSSLKKIKIKRNMGWCNDVKSKKYYNKLIKINKKKIRHEKLFRKDYKYDFMIPINYNIKATKIGKGSAIFLHLTKKYKTTSGCVALERKDFLILLKLINNKTKIKLA